MDADAGTDDDGGRSAAALLLAAAASAGAGLVHAAAAGTHSEDGQLTWLFSLTALVQVAWAAWAAAGALREEPSRGALRRPAVVGVVLGLLAVAAWTLSRTSGLPVLDVLSEREAVGLQDATAAALGGASSLLAGLSLRRVRPRERGRLRPAPTAAAAVALLALAVPGVAATHEHGGAAHGGGAAGHEHGEPPAEGVATDGSSHDHHGQEGPITSLDDPRVTGEQRAAAQQLIDDTIDGMARFSTVESVQAAGYVTIGDGVTGWEHYIHVGHIADGVELDPDRIESVVFKVHPDGTRQLASAMYILDFGKTMDDVPDVAGELTTWHDHQDLCWIGVRVVATTDARGNCPRGVFRGTSPMLHVWMLPHPCGPFAGIEGSHGSGCGHEHADDPEEQDEVAAAGP